MGLFGKKSNKKGKKNNSDQSPPRPQWHGELIEIGAKAGYFDAYNAMANIALKEAERFAETPNNNMADQYLLSFYRKPLKLEKASCFPKTDKPFSLTFYFSYPVPKELEENRELMGRYSIFVDLESAVIAVTYDINQIFLFNSSVWIDGNPNIQFYLVSEGAFDKEFMFDDEVLLSPRKFYVYEAYITNTPVVPSFLSDAEKPIQKAAPKKEVPVYSPPPETQTNGNNILLMSGLEFEHFCKEILISNGFSNVEVTKSSHDYGGDILAQKDQIKYVIQCKKYSSPVGIDAVQQVIGSRSIYNCHVAAVLTNSTFTDSAIKLAETNNVLLWDKATLNKMMSHLHTNSQNANSTHLSNGDSINVSQHDSLTLIMVTASSKRYANIAMAVLTIIADMYDFSELGITVSFDNQMRKIVIVDGDVGSDYEFCSWTATVSQPLSEEEKKYVASIIHTVEDETKADKKVITLADDDMYCEYNTIFQSRSIMTQKMYIGETYSFQITFRPQTDDEAIISYVFYSETFMPQISAIQYDYSLAIAKDSISMFMHKQAPNDEITVFIDSNGDPTEQVPDWTSKTATFDTQSSKNSCILKSYSCCFIEFINKINLLSFFDD